MKMRRKSELKARAVGIVAQEARHLADAADLDHVAATDAEDDYLRAELRRLADVIDARLGGVS